MLLNRNQRDAIENLAATFFEKSDDLIAVSSGIEAVIERRLDFAKKRGGKMKFTVIGRLNDKEYRKEVTAHNVKEALEMVIIQNVYEIRELLGNGEIQWEVEEDFL